MSNWTVLDGENNTLGFLDAANKYDAQDSAQSGWPDVIDLWIKETEA